MSCFVAGDSRWLDALFNDIEGGNKWNDNNREACLGDVGIEPEFSSSTKILRIESPPMAQSSLFSSKIQRRRDRDWTECQKHEIQDRNKKLKLMDSEEETLSVKDTGFTTLSKPVNNAQPKQKAKQKRKRQRSPSGSSSSLVGGPETTT
jgi:hypothetical protein